MASQAERVALRDQRQAVRIVAVGAADTGLVHPALPEGAVFVHLTELLAVGVVEVGVEQRGQVVVVERLAGHRRGDQLRSTRVARGTDLDLAFRASLEIDESVVLRAPSRL